MAKFGDQIKTILLDIERFLKVTLKGTSLPPEAEEGKGKLLSNINTLREEWQQLNPDPEDRKKLDDEAMGKAGDSGGTLSAAKSESNLLDTAQVPGITAADAQQDAAKTGFLFKRSADKKKDPMKAFKKKFSSKRYFVLKANTLYCFDKQNSTKQKWAVTMEGYEAKDITEENKKEFLFEMTNPQDKRIVFEAASQEEVKDWVVALNTEAGVEEAPEYYDERILDKKADDDDDGIEEALYEDTTDMVRPDPRPPVKAAPPLPSVSSAEDDEELYDEGSTLPGAKAEDSNDDDEIYDDGTTAAEEKSSPKAPTSVASSHGKEDEGEMDELYDECSTQEKGQDDDGDADDIYEAYDDIKAEVEEQASQPVTNAPPPILPNRSKLHDVILRDKSKKAGPQLPPRNDNLPTKPLPAPPTKTEEKPGGGAEETKDKTGDNYFESLYYGVWDCKADSENELSFSRGDVIQVLSKTHCGPAWWVGKLNDKVGIVPCGYLSAAYELVA